MLSPSSGPFMPPRSAVNRIIARLLFLGIAASLLTTFALYAVPAQQRAITQGRSAPLLAMAKAIPPEHKESPDFRVDVLLKEPPAFDLPDMRGKFRSLKEFEGKVVFLNFWASWCAPCREEWRGMQEMAERMKGEDFIVIAVSTDEDDSKLMTFLEEEGLSSQVLILRDRDAKTASRFGTTAYPETYLLDTQGQLIHRVVGPRHWESPQALSYLRALLSGGES
jgi:cytochrome c biogenesis protein CcmG, thiol:disulfide interchange protein DsbE